MLHKDYDYKGLAEKEITDHEPQGAWHQGELIAGNPPVVK
jgi:hypothetical protein